MSHISSKSGHSDSSKNIESDSIKAKSRASYMESNMLASESKEKLIQLKNSRRRNQKSLVI